MNHKDKLIQEHKPVVLVPAYEALAKLEMGKTRFVMASDGLWIESRQPWVHLCLPLWKSKVHLPYGLVERCFEMVYEPIDGDVRRQIKKDALRWCGYEYAGAITYTDDALVYQEIEDVLERGLGSVSYKVPPHVVVDIHSHGYGAAYFSEQDDKDDQGGVRISLVLGHCKGDGKDITFALRLCVEGYFFGEQEIPEMVEWLTAKA